MNNAEPALLAWLDDPALDRGVHLAKPGNEWEFTSYRDLADRTARIGSCLIERGVRPGDVVALVQRSSPDFIACMFGAISIGATPCVVAPPFAYQGADRYERHASQLLRMADPATVVVDEEALGRVTDIVRDFGWAQPLSAAELGDPGALRPARPPTRSDTALLQFTSGSSGVSRGVRISRGALESNLAGMRNWLGWTSELRSAMWLPVHHDMGLVGGVFNSVTNQSDFWLLQPEDFIRSPLRFLSCLSANRVGVTALPNFALAYILRRVRPADLDELSFDALRCVILGAERIDADLLRRFGKLLAYRGFDDRALLPAYGSAEATLAITGLRRGVGWTSSAPDSDKDSVRTEPEAELVGCGPPLDGVTLAVVDEAGRPVPDGRIGEITVTGSTVATGYTGDPGSASGTVLDGRCLHTGDAGFLRDGQLFVLGRLGDGLKVRGRMVFAESLEARLVEHGVPERRAAVLLGVRDGVATAAVALELPKPEWVEAALGVLREEDLENTRLITLSLPRGGLAVTSSGKPRRRVMWQALCGGELGTEVVHASR